VAVEGRRRFTERRVRGEKRLLKRNGQREVGDGGKEQAQLAAATTLRRCRLAAFRRRTTSLPRSKTRGAGFAGEEEKKGNLNVGKERCSSVRPDARQSSSGTVRRHR
jgi:hypothetical protein